MTEELFHGAMQVMALVGIIVLFMTAWQKFVVDICRQRAFEIRDAALLWAHDHGRLDSVEYKDFRDSVNGAIRYCEDMTLLKVILTALLRGSKAPKLSSLSGTAFIHDQHLHKEFRRLSEIMAIGLILRSAIGLLFLMLSLPIVLLSIAFNGINRPKRIASRLQTEVQNDILMAT